MHEAKKKGADFLSTDNHGSSLTEILIDSHYADYPHLCMEGIETILEIVQNDDSISEEDKLNMLSDVLKQASKYNDKPMQSTALKYCSEENLDKLSQLSGIDNLPKIAPTKITKESNYRPNLQWTKPQPTKSEEISTSVTKCFSKKIRDYLVFSQ